MNGPQSGVRERELPRVQRVRCATTPVTPWRFAKHRMRAWQFYDGAPVGSRPPKRRVRQRFMMRNTRTAPTIHPPGKITPQPKHLPDIGWNTTRYLADGPFLMATCRSRRNVVPPASSWRQIIIQN
jgi:hypothetical protein